MRRSVVVTFLGALAACSGKARSGTPAPTEDEARAGGTPAPTEAATPAPTEAATEAGTPEPIQAAFTRVLNAEHPEHGRIFRKQGPVCYVRLPLPAQEGPPVGFRMPPVEEVPCPPSMTDPAWAECAHGTVTATEDGSACRCAVLGNPPPPPRVLAACPTPQADPEGSAP